MYMDATDAIFYILILVMSVVIHEVAHGYMALRYGDKTALYEGRLTLNPIPHLDLFGSIILPALLFFSGSPFMIGWAKPVPYNPDNLSDRKWGSIAVAAAGILANLSLAVIFGLILRFTSGIQMPDGFSSIISLIVVVNLVLAIFNLVPIPPLDGSKILYPLLPTSFQPIISFIEQFALIFLIVFILFFSDSIYPILSFLFQLITGTPL